MNIKKLANRALVALFFIVIIIYLIVWFPNRHDLVLNPSLFLTEYSIIIGGFLPIIFGFILLNLFWKGYREENFLKLVLPKLIRSVNVVKDESHYLGEIKDKLINEVDKRAHNSQIILHLNTITNEVAIIVDIRHELLNSVDKAAFQFINTKITELNSLVSTITSIDLSRTNPDDNLFNINSDIGIVANVLYTDLINYL